MGEIILDECLAALYEAQEYAKEYVELSEYKMIFEASNPEVAQQMKNNSAVEEKTENAIIRAIRAVKDVIKNIIKSIGEFFKTLGMSQSEYQAFKDFKERCKKDPSLANKKITVADYRKINAEYDSVIAELDKAIRDEKMGKDVNADSLVQKATRLLKQGVGDATIVVTLDAARKLAESNMTAANLIKTALEADSSLMDEIESQLGSGRAKKFKKDIDRYSKIVHFARIRSKLFKKKYAYLQHANRGIAEELHSLKNDMGRAIDRAGYDLLKGGIGNKNSRMAGDILHTKTGKETMKTATKLGKFAAKNALKGAAKSVPSNIKYDAKKYMKKQYDNMSETLHGSKIKE